MDVDQVISGIGSAVASAQSQNICVYWCLTKSEWASWVQAVGVVISLLIAIFLPRLERMRAQKDNLILAKVGVEELCGAIELLQEALDESTSIGTAFSSKKEEVSIAQNLLKEVKIHMLPASAISPWHSILAVSEGLSRLEKTSGSTDGAYKLLRKKIFHIEHVYSEFEKNIGQSWWICLKRYVCRKLKFK